MSKFSKEGINVFIILDRRSKNKEGLCPVKIQTSFQRKQHYYKTGKYLTEKEWESLNKAKSKNLINIRHDINSTFERVKSTVNILIEEDKFSFDNLETRLTNKAGTTVNNAFIAKIETLKEEKSIGNSIVYSTAYKHFKKYVGKQVQFNEITVSWLKKYEKKMLDENKSFTTISIYMRCLRCLFNEAIDQGYVKSSLYPFGKKKYEVPVGKGRKLALNMEQIKKIVSFTDGSEATELYRDLWFFSYLWNGINMNDMLRLKYCNIQEDEISYYRSKSIKTSKEKRKIHAIITTEMKQIIKRWGNKDRNPESYIFPFLNGIQDPMLQKKKVQDITRRINRKLNAVTTHLKMGKISTYTARHSFATVLNRKGVQISYISESLGHSTIQTTETYLASLQKENRIKNASLLTEFE